MPGGLRLHFNENTAGCSEAVVAALRAMSREDVAVYPDCAALTARVEQWFGVEPGWVQITNGLDEGLQMVAQYGAWHFRARASQPETLVVEPSFEV